MHENDMVSDNTIKLWVIKLKKAVASLSSSFWFIPTLMIMTALVLAQYILPFIASNMIITDFTAGLGISSPHTSMQAVQVVASSMITVTSIAFSMTLVALVMASNSFGPRLIQSFMQSKKTQFVLGFLSASFVYCLIVLSQIRINDVISSHPVLSVLVALFLAVACVFVLIFFIHHVAVSIRADTVVEAISISLGADMMRLQGNQSDRATDNFGANSLEQYRNRLAIKTNCKGYLQAIEYETLADLAAKYDGVLVMNSRAGKYIFPDIEIAHLYSNDVLPTQLSIDSCIVTGSQRTALQDPQFAINQLVEMALRALSPSMDDPFTAITCIDKLIGAMSTFTSKTLPNTCVLDDKKVVRVLTNEESFDDLFAGAFTQIRQSSMCQLAVLCHLLDVFYVLLMSKKHEEHLASPISIQANAIKGSMENNMEAHNELDRNAVLERLERIEDELSLSM